MKPLLAAIVIFSAACNCCVARFHRRSSLMRWILVKLDRGAVHACPDLIMMHCHHYQIVHAEFLGGLGGGGQLPGQAYHPPRAEGTTPKAKPGYFWRRVTPHHRAAKVHAVDLPIIRDAR